MLIGPLHFGNFAGWWSRATWFALGAATAYVTWSGLILWIRRRQDEKGWRALGRANVWVGGGLPLAMTVSAVAFFLALPSLTTSFWVPASFVITAVLALFPALMAERVERVTPWLFAVTGALLVSLPLLRYGVGGASWTKAVAAGVNTVIVLDCLVIFGGIACMTCARLALVNKDATAQIKAGGVPQAAE